MPVPGETFGGRYRLDDRIAAGGMGEVWRATDTLLGRRVAVKTLRAEGAGDLGFQSRFRHEARAMAALHHPNIADVYDFGETAGGTDAYIVMEFVDGAALNNVIAERGRLSPTETMSIVMQAAKALGMAHQAGIVHRDVKPGNLILQADGTVKLVDFGVSRSAESAALTGAREVVGTALYIAPEQVSKDTTGPPADMYALGCVAYHCLTGHPPFDGDSPIAIAIQHVKDEPRPLPPDVGEAVRSVVRIAMAKDPAQRFPDAAAMAAAADRATSGVSPTATATLVADFSGTRVDQAPVSNPRAAAVAPAAGGRASAPVAPPGRFDSGVYSSGSFTAPPQRDADANRRRALIIGVVVAALLAIGGGAWALAQMGGDGGSPSKPAATTQPADAPEPTAGNDEDDQPTEDPGRGNNGGDRPTNKPTTARPTTEPTTSSPSPEPTRTTTSPTPTATETTPPGDDDGGDPGNGGDQGDPGNDTGADPAAGGTNP